MRAHSCGHCGIWEPCWPTPGLDGVPPPCPPCLDLDVDPDTGEPDTPDDFEAWEAAWCTAVSHVYDCTCQRWTGDCWAEIVRPCPPSCVCPPKNSRFCRCGRWEALDLSSAFCLPPQEILGVIVNGELWDQPWRLEQVHHSAPCMDGASCGPFLVVEDCGRIPIQNLNAPLGEECTFAVIARTGCPPPKHIYQQTIKLAVELLRSDPTSCAHDPDNCALPDGVSQMSRKGLTVQFDRDRTGLPLLDKAIQKWACMPEDFEMAVDPSADLTHHRQWIGPIGELETALAGLGLPGVALGAPVPVIGGC